MHEHNISRTSKGNFVIYNDISNVLINYMVDSSLNSGMKSIVTLVPFARTSPTLTLPKEDFLEIVLYSTLPKESSFEKILGLPPNLQSRLPSISSVVVHSISVPEVASKYNIFPALHVKALPHTV